MSIRGKERFAGWISFFTIISDFSLLSLETDSKAGTCACYLQIRKLRRELDASQEKVSALTTQLTANVSIDTESQVGATRMGSKTRPAFWHCLKAPRSLNTVEVALHNKKDSGISIMDRNVSSDTGCDSGQVLYHLSLTLFLCVLGVITLASLCCLITNACKILSAY
jgi:hypothetical protein